MNRYDARDGRLLLPADAGPRALLVVCDATAYPLARHCRYARHRGGAQTATAASDAAAASDATAASDAAAASDATFENTEFHAGPPGLRTGPWPGWRGIPPMPALLLASGDARLPGVFEFWGDEEITGRLRCRFLIPPGAGGACALHAEDARIVPLHAEAYPVAEQRVAPRPFALRAELAGRHPRLLVTPEDVPALRRRAAGTHAAAIARIEALLREDDGGFRVTAESKLPAGPERLAAEDRVVLAALLALLRGDPAHRAAAADALLAYAELTRAPGFEPLRIDTQSGEVLFTLCFGIDALHDALPADDREALAARADAIAEQCWSYLDTGRTDYAQAHFLGCGLGVLAHALLFWERHARARERAAFLLGALEHVLRLLPADGFYPHGINLWSYEHGFLLRWMEMLRCAATVDLWSTTPAIANASRFRGSATAPDARYALAFGDPQFLVAGDAWCHQLIAARCAGADAAAARRAAALARALRELPVAGVDFRHAPARRRAWEFLFDDGAAADRPEPSPGHAPAAASRADAGGWSLDEYADGGQLFARGGDALFTCRCGPPLGRSRLRGGMQGGYGHADPCNGSFLLWVRRDMLAAGPGPVYRRDTALQNLFTVDGRGQIGDGCVWLPDFIPPELMPGIPVLARDGASIRIRMDLARAYLPALGVAACTRELALHPSRIEGVDAIRCERPALLAWNFHTRCAVARDGDGALRLSGDGLEAELRWSCDHALDAVWAPAAFVPAYPNDGVRSTHLRLLARATDLRIAWTLSWR